MRSNCVVVLDLDATRRRMLTETLSERCLVHAGSSAATFLRLISDHSPAVALIGRVPGGNPEAKETAHRVREMYPAAKLVIVADHSSEGTVVDALRAGVAEYLR